MKKNKNLIIVDDEEVLEVMVQSHIMYEKMILIQKQNEKIKEISL